MRSQQHNAGLKDLAHFVFTLVSLCSTVWATRHIYALQLIWRLLTWSCALLSAWELAEGAFIQMPLNNANMQVQMQAPMDLPPLPPLAFLAHWLGKSLLISNPIIIPHELADAANPALRQRKRLRFFLLCLSCMLALEYLNWFHGPGNQEWFTQLLTLLRFTPLTAGIIALPVAALFDLWRNRWLQGILLVSVMLECAFWTFDFRSRSMELFGLFLWQSVALSLWTLVVALVRAAPVTSVLVALGYMIAKLAMIIVPVLNLDPAAQNWPLLFNIVRHNPELRRCYKVFGVTCMAAAMAQGAYLFAGSELSWVADAWTKLRSVLWILALLAYNLTVADHRSVMFGLALLRFIRVIDQSLPIATLAIHSSPPTGSTEAPCSSSLPAPAVPVPSVVCLSCARHACPFTLVRWLQDFLFESTLLFCWPLSGVQAVHVQKHEQNMQITDTAQTIKAARQAQRQERKSHEETSAVSEEDGEDDLPLQVQTCQSCLLHSIRAQLLLPFVCLLVLSPLLSVLLPPPPLFIYRNLLHACTCLLLDRVPCVALFDVVQGWWSGRVLKWKRAYIGLTSAVLAYSSYMWWACSHAIASMSGESLDVRELSPAPAPLPPRPSLSRVVCFAVSRLPH